jgi:hypothetical protein
MTSGSVLLLIKILGELYQFGSESPNQRDINPIEKISIQKSNCVNAHLFALFFLVWCQII